MRTYGSNIHESRRKIKKAHAKAKFAGVLYFLGTLALAVLAFLPALNVKFAGKEGLSILTLFSIFSNFGENKLDILNAVLYLILLVIAIACLFKAFARLGRVLKKNYKNVNKCNRNVAAMERLGDTFSTLFGAVVIINLLVYTISPVSLTDVLIIKDSAITLFGFISLIVGLLVHFIAGIVGGTCSLFIVDLTLDERKRPDSIAIYFFRNLLQVIVVGGLFFLVAPMKTIYLSMQSILGGNMAELNIVPFAIQAVALIILIVMTKHATNRTEYNLMGMDGAGMRTYTVGAILMAIVCVVAYFLDTEANDKLINYIVAAVLALLGFIFDLIIKPNEKRVKIEEFEVEDYEAPQVEEENVEEKQPETQRPQGRPYPCMPPMMPMMCPMMARPCGQMGQMGQMPRPQMQQEVVSCMREAEMDRRNIKTTTRYIQNSEEELKYARKQAALNEKKASRNSKKAKKLAKKEEKFASTLKEEAVEVEKPVPQDPDSFDVKLSLPKSLFAKLPVGLPEGAKGLPEGEPPVLEEDNFGVWELACPKCGKKLIVRSGVPYHRCAACGGVFQLRRGKKNVVPSAKESV